MSEEVEFPERGELVVATVKEIKRFGAYLELDDYGIKAYLPISEVSSRWVRNISDVIRVGEKIVVKVLRIDYRTRMVDVSLKEVSQRERDRVLRQWKRDQRGIQIISEMIDELGLDAEEVEEKLVPLVEKQPTIYDALEQIVIDPSWLDKLGFKDKKKEILEFLSKRVTPKKYVYEARFRAFHIGKNGVDVLKKNLEEIEKAVKKASSDIEVEIFNDGTPFYKIRVKSYRPEVIKRKVVPLLKDFERKLRSKINIEIREERTEIEV